MRVEPDAAVSKSTPPVVRTVSGCLGLFAVAFLGRLYVTSTVALLVPLLMMSVLWPLVSPFSSDRSPLSSLAPLFVSTGYALGTYLADLRPSPLPPVPDQYYVWLVGIASVLSIGVYAADNVLTDSDPPRM